jgi:SAM-dependent methyltransferase
MLVPPEAAFSVTAEPIPCFLRHWVDSELAPNVGLARLFMMSASAAEAQCTLDRALRNACAHDDCPAIARLDAMLKLWQQLPGAYDLVASVLEVERPPTECVPTIAELRTVFDRAAALSSEAGVALYSLGSPAVLNSATEEIIARMRHWGLTGPDRLLLELGCGNGRCVEQLAGEAHLIVGIDISEKMLEHARARCAGMEHTAFVRVSGEDLAAFRDASFDLIYAVDSFPYLWRVGPEFVSRHFREARRLLRPAGSLLILNFSYRGDIDLDRASIARLAEETELDIEIDGTREFQFWDGVTFLLRQKEPGWGRRHEPTVPEQTW